MTQRRAKHRVVNASIHLFSSCNISFVAYFTLGCAPSPDGGLLRDQRGGHRLPSLRALQTRKLLLKRLPYGALAGAQAALQGACAQPQGPAPINGKQVDVSPYCVVTIDQ
jgi:hypothetical protein